MLKKDETKDIKDKIAKAYDEVILKEEVRKLKQQLAEQMRQAEQNLEVAKRQAGIWQARIN